MSILNPKAKSSPPATQMPRVVPPQARPPMQLHEEAVRFGQSIVDLQQTAARLQEEVAEWERRAKLAEEEVRRLEMRIAQMEKTFHEREEQLTEQRDRWKIAYADVEKSLQMAGGIILDIVKKSETRRSLNVNLNTLAESIENPPPAMQSEIDKDFDEAIREAKGPDRT